MSYNLVPKDKVNNYINFRMQSPIPTRNELNNISKKCLS